MANRSTKAKRDFARAEIVAKRRGDGKNVNPPRKNSLKDFGKYKNFPGYRKERKPENLVKVYKELAAA